MNKITRFYWAGFLLIILAVGVQVSAAQEEPVVPSGSPIHPTYPLIDADGNNVLDSGAAVSTMQTCGACHDAEFIASHSFHTDAGLSQFVPAGEEEDGHTWDSSPGSFGHWNPLLYRYLSPAGDENVDLTTPEWVQWFVRHSGGGPAENGRNGQPLTSLIPAATDVETSIYDPETGEFTAWNWQSSGTVEMNCFLCHLANPNNEARIAALAAGDFAGASTATLIGTGLVETAGTGWQWNEAAFDQDGRLRREFVTVQDPTTTNCGQCHGLTYSNPNTPLTLEAYTLSDYSTMTTGQVMSGQRIADSGLNLAGKEGLSRSWDVHMERVFDCTNCHYSLNNPIYFQEAAAAQPDHLTFDPRRLDLGEYIYRPLHEFAKGQSVQSLQAPGVDNTLRRCESCHSLENSHDWLPYQERHTAALACETCHIPELYAPAVQYVDWTVLQTDSTPVIAYRGLEGDGFNANTLLTGYEPVLLPRQNSDGQTPLAPFNLVTAWYWVYGDPERPIPLRDLQAAWLDGNDYPDEVLAVFDADSNGRLDTTELVLDHDNKVTLLTRRLEDLGLDNPHIASEIQPFSINHNITFGEWATRECSTCHSPESRVTQPLSLSDRTPGGVVPELKAVTGLLWTGEVQTVAGGTLTFQPKAEAAGLYVLGHNAVTLIDMFGAIAFAGVLLGIFLHGGLRWWVARRQAGHQPATLQEVYMYDVYERLWHWLQTAAILLLLFTGLIIHKPETFGLFSFSYMVQVHNILAAILVINAALSLFYHLASGEIRQFLPRPRGFFDQAIAQSLYYVRGIFRQEPHPFAKTRQHKLNPLQQMTYFAILNVLLPLQILTGALMWGAQRWPEIATRLGGLPFLAPAHTLIAWLFATFIVMHVYLTTTGHTPLAGIRAMMMGWDEVETPEGEAIAEASSLALEGEGRGEGENRHL